MSNSWNPLSDFPSNKIRAASEPYRLPQGTDITLPFSYEFEDRQKDSLAFLKETETVALMVIYNGQFRYENYWLTGGADVNWMSISKSFVSALIGIALEEGLINSRDCVKNQAFD